MNGSTPLPTIDALKDQARRLRTALDSDGATIGHGQALELLAHQHGYKDWNTLHAAIGNRPPPCPVSIGERVHGNYLGQAFEGEVIGVEVLSTPDRFRVTFDFDEPVDVVRFASFSNLRKRVACVIDGRGATAEKTSDGRPQLTLRL
jgi:hypothetical protein